MAVESAESAGEFAEYVVWPIAGSRPVPEQVPEAIVEDYREAVLVLQLSPKASAALSRRCLQAVLKDAGGATKYRLIDQIKEVMPTLPAYISKTVDCVRNVGNLATHPIHSESTGEIVDVEPGEAELNLLVLDQLFDHYYVKPMQAQEQLARLNEKLADAGRKPVLSDT